MTDDPANADLEPVFPSEENRLVQWRSRLRARDNQNLIDPTSVDRLCGIARDLVHFYFRTPKQLSPSAIKRELEQLAKGLERASLAIRRMGAQGMTRLHAASCSIRDDPDSNIVQVSADILVMSQWAMEANAVSQLDDRGEPVPGRVVDLSLRGVARTLGSQFLSLLALQPQHTVDPATGQGVSLFNEFLIAAFADFAPSDRQVSWRQLDRAAAEAVRLLKEDF